MKHMHQQKLNFPGISTWEYQGEGPSDESNQSKVAHHSDEVDDEEHQEERNLQPGLICEHYKDKLSHKSLVSYCHVCPGQSLE